MNGIHAAIERRFEQLGFLMYRHRFKALVGTFLFIAALVSRIPTLTLDTSSEALLRETDPSRLEYNAFQDEFGRAELIFIAITAPDIFTPDTLSRLRDLHRELEEEVPYLKEVTSLVNARDTRGEDDQLIVEDFLEGWPKRSVAMDDLRRRAVGNPVHVNHLVSADGRHTAVIIEAEARIGEADSDTDLLSGFEDTGNASPDAAGGKRYFSEAENRRVVESIHRIVARHNGPDFTLTLAGGPVVIHAFNEATLVNIRILIVLSIAAIALFLALLFRRVSGVVLPVIIVIAALASTLGLMGLFQVPVKLTTTIIPGFLLAVGVGDSVHVLAIFYRLIQQGAAKADAIAGALGHSGIAIVMTSLTTAAGLLSFSAAELTAIAEMGVFAAAGVMLALLYTIIMLPAMLALTPIRPNHSPRNRAMSRVMDRILIAVADTATGHPLKIVGIGAALFIIAAVAVFRLEFSHDVIRYFPDSSPVKQAVAAIDQVFRGTITLEVVVDTGATDGILNPAVLERIESLAGELPGLDVRGISVGKVFAVTDILKEIHKALHDNDPAYYRVPTDRDTVAQEMLLFENSGADDLERVVDRDYRKTRVTVKTPWVDAVICRAFMDEIRHRFTGAFGNRAEVSITGIMALMARAIVAAIHSMAQSYGIALGVIAVMMVVLVADLKLGLISMIPNLLPILITMGLIGLAGIPLDINTLMIGSIAIGLVVDDTVHFMYNFKKYYGRSGNVRDAVRQTLLGAGRALLITSLTLCTGFFILMVATLENMVKFGFFTGITILFALVADFLLAPALLTLMVRYRSQ